MNPAKNKKRITISKTGLSYILVSTFFLITGLLRGELVSTICGTLFLVYLLLVFLQVCITYFLWKKVSFTTSWRGNSCITISVENEKIKGSAASFFIAEALYCVDFYSLNDINSTHSFLLRVVIDQKEIVYNFDPPKRGFYQPTRPHLEIHDLSRFFTITVPLEEKLNPDPLIVQPVPAPPVFSNFTQTHTGNTRGKSTFKRSEDLYETRNYTPGDDPRKINWKVYAHTGELTIRQGELMPPPSKEYFLLINRFNSFGKTENIDMYFEILISRMTFIALSLINQKKTVTIITINDKDSFNQTIVKESSLAGEKTILDLLAIPQLATKEIPFEHLLKLIPENGTFFFFSLPQKTIPSEKTKTGNRNIYRFIGPILPEATKKDLKSRIIPYLFIGKVSKRVFSSSTFSALVSSNIAVYQKRGENVSKI